MTLYFDYNATTPYLPALKSAMTRLSKLSGNPSSHYEMGRAAKEVLEVARESLSTLLGFSQGEFVFTGSGTEANNMVLKSFLWRFLRTGEPCHIITSAIEHPAVLETLDWMAGLGVAVTQLPVDAQGRVSRETLAAEIREDTRLISIMMANNETGGLLGIESLIPVAQAANIPFHSDIVQAVGRLPISLSDLGLDFATVSGHKFHGLKGAGGLYVRDEALLEPLIHGGPQEKRLRAGTEAVLPIAMMGAAAKWVTETGLDQMARVVTLRDHLWHSLSAEVPSSRLNTPLDTALPNTLNISFTGVPAEGLVMRLDLEGVAVSTGSACSTGTTEPSHVLSAMGCEHADCAVRFSLGVLTTKEEVDQLVDLLVQLLS